MKRRFEPVPGIEIVLTQYRNTRNESCYQFQDYFFEPIEFSLPRGQKGWDVSRWPARLRIGSADSLESAAYIAFSDWLHRMRTGLEAAP